MIFEKSGHISDLVILVASTNYELVGGTTAKIKVGRGTDMWLFSLLYNLYSRDSIYALCVSP